jgi:hypothetical protein
MWTVIKHTQADVALKGCSVEKIDIEISWAYDDRVPVFESSELEINIANRDLFIAGKLLNLEIRVRAFAGDLVGESQAWGCLVSRNNIEAEVEALAESSLTINAAVVDLLRQIPKEDHLTRYAIRNLFRAYQV